MDRQSQAEELIQLLITLAHLPEHERTEQMARGEGALLIYLALRHDGATAGELRAALDVGSGRVANALKNLEAKGLVIRTPSAADGRVVQVFLTQLGRDRILQRYQLLLQRTHRLLEELGEEDSAAFLRLTRKVILTADKVNREFTGPVHSAIR